MTFLVLDIGCIHCDLPTTVAAECGSEAEADRVRDSLAAARPDSDHAFVVVEAFGKDWIDPEYLKDALR